MAAGDDVNGFLAITRLCNCHRQINPHLQTDIFQISMRRTGVTLYTPLWDNYILRTFACQKPVTIFTHASDIHYTV